MRERETIFDVLAVRTEEIEARTCGMNEPLLDIFVATNIMLSDREQ